MSNEQPEPTAFEQDIRAATAGIVMMAAVLGIVVFQYLGPIIKPLFVAAFLYYLVTPAAELLIHRGVRRWLGYLVAIILLAALMVTFGFIVYANIRAVERRFPYYVETITAWADRLATKTRVVGKAPEARPPLPKEEKKTADHAEGDQTDAAVQPEVAETPPEESSEAPTQAAPEVGEKETPVESNPEAALEIRRQAGPAGPGPLGDLFNITPTDLISWGFGTALGFAGNMVAILFYLVFIILEAHQFPGRLRRAFAAETADRFIRFGRDVSESVRQYLVLKTLISLGTGIAAAVIMLLFGLEFWPLWAILTFLFNYVPYIGSIAATAFPILIGFVQFGNPWLAGLMAVLLAINQQIWGNLVEPQVMGKHLNVSPLALLIFVAYWGWLWGIIGMVLSVPLAVFVKMLLAFFPRTQKVAILLSAE